MKKHKFKQLHRLSIPLLGLIILLCFFYSITGLGKDHAARDKHQLEQALTRAAVACYAAEGVYPPDTVYLEEHYGIQINKELYSVKYEVIASNLMPDITVLEKRP